MLLYYVILNAVKYLIKLRKEIFPSVGRQNDNTELLISSLQI